MNKTVKRLISILLVMVMCFSMLAPTASAWTSLSHVNSADLILLELQRSARQNGGNAKITVYAPYYAHNAGNTYSYAIPLEYQDAIFSYPDAFRSGALGPDFYPDMVTGQMYTHPYFTNPVDQSKVESGEWITLLCNSVNRLPKNSKERKEALSFALGYMLHFCGDLFGHDFVNSFSGGTYPSYSDVNLLDATDAELNNIVSHMSVENYMDKFVNSEFYSKNGYLGIDGPLQFIADTMLFNGSSNAGSASIFEKYGSVPYQYEYLIELRTSIYNKANEWRETMNPFLAMCVTFCDHWIEDIDRATYALVECFNNIAKRMVTGEKNPVIEEEKKKEEEENGGPSMMDEIIEECFGELSLGDSASTIGIIKEELGYWLNHYGSYATPIPDIFIDGIPYVDEILDFILKAIGIGFVFEGIEKLLKLIVKEIIVYALQEYIPELQEIAVALPGYAEKVMDPSRQLDSEYNPYKPSANNFAEFKVYMDKYAEEQKLLSNTTATGIINGNDNGIFDKVVDSDFEAFYNTLVMFKLVIMGPQNFASFINSTTGVQLQGFEEKLTYIEATSLRLEIATADLYTAGTDDNVFAEVYYVDGGRRTRIMRKLLDKSNYNDFEAGDNDVYDVELPYPVRIDKLEVAIKQEDTDTAGEGWMCQNINITPMHAGVALIDPIGVGGNFYMKSGTKWYVGFQDSLNERGIADPRKQTVTNVKLKIKTSSEATYGGTDSDIYLVAYNGTTEWSKVCLDKPGYNDFEKGDNDEYNVSIEKYNKSTGLMEGIPLDKLALKIKHSGSDEWTIADMDVILCNGDLNLIAAKDSGLSGTALEDEEVLIGQLKNANIPDSYFKKYSKPSLSYKTSVNDNLLFFVNSIDGSQQWADYENALWNDSQTRKKVFFEIFKGFRPEMKYSAPKTISPGEAFDVTVDLEGMWNGITEARRNAITDLEDMPEVNGKVAINYLDKNGNTILQLPKTVTNNVAEIRDFSSDKLKAGYYDVRIDYFPDTSNPVYGSATLNIKDALCVVPGLDFTAQSPAMSAGKAETTLYFEVGHTATFTFDNADAIDGYTITKSGKLADKDGKTLATFSGDPAKLTYKFNTMGIYTLTETLTLKKGSTVEATKTHTFYISVDKAKVVPEILQQAESAVSVSGDTYTFTARAKDAVSAVWYKYKTNGAVVSVPDSSFNVVTGESTVTVNRASHEDGTKYYCLFKSADNMTNYTKNATLCFAPTVLSAGDCIADIGSTAFLKVEVTGCSHYNSSEHGWYKDGVKLNAGDKYYPMGATLAVQSVRSTDAGAYTYKYVTEHGDVVTKNVALVAQSSPLSKYIDTFVIFGLDNPITVGTVADTEVSVPADAKYTVESVTWTGVQYGTNIVNSATGSLKIKLKAKSGYTFMAGDMTGHVEGIPKTVYSVPSGATEITVTVDYNQYSSWRFVFPESDDISITTESLIFRSGTAASGQKIEGTYTCDHGDLPLTTMHHTGGMSYSLYYETGNALPDGLTLNKDGTITGTPTTGGVYTVKILAHSVNSGGTASNSCGQTVKTVNFVIETAEDHTHSTKIVTNTATCTKAGIIAFECGCSAKVDAINHHYSEATCTLAKTCILCHATDGEPLGHSFDNACDTSCNKCLYVRSNPPHAFSNACDADCNECGETRTPDAHKYTAACDITCNECGAMRSAEAHTGGTATCTERAKCDACDEYYGKTVDHDYLEATCTTPTTCKVCGFTAGAQLGHAGGIATCTEQAVCAECGVKYGELAAHKVSEVKGKAATCTANGTIDHYKCDDCGALCSDSDGLTVITDTTVKATGHSINKVAAVSATCTKEGLTEGKKCTACGFTTVEQKTVAKKAHSLTTLKAVAATYKTDGKTEGKKCTVCGTVTVPQKTVAKKVLGKVTGLKTKAVKLSSGTKTTLTLAWTKVADAEKYEVYQQSGKKWKKIGTTSKTTLTVKKLKSNKSYKFKVRAIRSDAKGAYSSVFTGKTVPLTPTVTLKTGKKALTASWKTVANITGYEVQASTSKKFTSKTTEKVTIKKAKTTKITIKKLSKGKKYYVKVRAYKTVGKTKVYSAWSAVKSVKVK